MMLYKDKNKLKSTLYDKHIQPFEAHLEKSFNGDTQLKKATIEILDELKKLLSPKIIEESKSLLNNDKVIPDILTDDKGILTKLFDFTIKHGPGIWNRQDGPICYLGRIVMATSWFRNQMIQQRGLINKICVFQLKLALKLLKCIRFPHGSSDKIKSVIKKLTRSSIPIDEKIHFDKKVVDVWNKKWPHAFKVINALACGLQFFVAVHGLIKFIEKGVDSNSKYQIDDYINLMSCISNAGLAITGLSPEKLANGMKIAGRGLAAFGCVADAIRTSLLYTKAIRRGDLGLQIICGSHTLINITGAALWIVGAMETNWVGWAFLAVIIAINIIYDIYKDAQTGMDNILNALLDQFEKNEDIKQIFKVKEGLDNNFTLIIAPMWRHLEDKSIEKFPAINGNFLKYKFRIDKISEKDFEPVEKYGKMSILPLNYNLTTFILLEMGWDEKLIQFISRDGEMIGTEDDDELYNKVRDKIKYYSKLLNSTAVNDIKILNTIRAQIAKIKNEIDMSLKK
jgi:hypothetical protein